MSVYFFNRGIPVVASATEIEHRMMMRTEHILVKKEKRNWVRVDKRKKKKRRTDRFVLKAK